MRDRNGAIDAPAAAQSPSRRIALKAGLGLAAGLATSTPSLARRLVSRPSGRELALFNLHTGEKLKAEYWRNGKYQPDALHAIAVVLRDHRNNTIHPIDPALLDLIHSLRARLRGAAPFNVISGYRSPESNALMHEASAGVAAHSLHMEGKAIDIRLPGAPLAAIKRTAMALNSGGVGYYPADDFVHVDTGRVRHWAG